MVSFFAASGRCLDHAMPDGNCLFRVISKQLCGNSQKLRKIITDYVAANPTLFKGWTTDHQSIEEHLSGMRNLGHWGVTLK